MRTFHSGPTGDPGIGVNNQDHELELKNSGLIGQPVSKEACGEKARSDAIDRQIIEDSKRYKKECKILLLGSGESGKSTIVKQMKIIHQAGFEELECAEYRTTIYKNVLDSAGTFARVVRRVKSGAFVEGREREYAMAVLRAHDEREQRGIQTGRVSTHPGTADVPTPAAHVLAQPQTHAPYWRIRYGTSQRRPPTVERLVDEHSADFSLIDSAVYFFSIHRIAPPTYVPSEEDVLRARAKYSHY
ncbi:Heterotrimeric G-protein alpha subunit [Mycena venus]|uniref:Heterotrimeric G-protein alpha subunit n=1 Tax=Mycena venus TaxID=2733690 RepID=A0A8H7D531_9AGAR|nr:Heterotrimeric G-protein alpha subunit [Mycena venus]